RQEQARLTDATSLFTLDDAGLKQALRVREGRKAELFPKTGAPAVDAATYWANEQETLWLIDQTDAIEREPERHLLSWLYVRCEYGVPLGPPSKTTLWRLVTGVGAGALDLTIGAWLLARATAQHEPGPCQSPSRSRTYKAETVSRTDAKSGQVVHAHDTRLFGLRPTRTTSASRCTLGRSRSSARSPPLPGAVRRCRSSASAPRAPSPWASCPTARTSTTTSAARQRATSRPVSGASARCSTSSTAAPQVRDGAASGSAWSARAAWAVAHDPAADEAEPTCLTVRGDQR
ncbi:MAG: hypothetical protein QOE54_3792, partial [Streptosporangiaceae bacterium]|nr:hypothetical protein [Streptosporangiaceae bacterium]